MKQAAMKRTGEHRKVRTSGNDRIFYLLCYLFIGILTLLVLYPIVYVVSASFSSAGAVSGGSLAVAGGFFAGRVQGGTELQRFVDRISEYYFLYGSRYCDQCGNDNDVRLSSGAEGIVRRQSGHVPVHFYHVVQRRHDPQLYPDGKAGHHEYSLGDVAARSHERL